MSVLARGMSAVREGRILSGISKRIVEACGPYVHWERATNPTAADAAMEYAFAHPSDLPRQVTDIEGMSGRRYRRTINSLVNSTPDARYLEIGSWTGSTAVAAMYGNAVAATCIDDWSYFGGRDAFNANVSSILTPRIDFRMIEKNFRAVAYDAIGKFNVYLFDGPHEEQDHYDGLAMVWPALDETFTLIVDDWNWSGVRTGTLRALKDAGASISSSVAVRTTLNDAHPCRGGKDSEWHNGCFFAVVER